MGWKTFWVGLSLLVPSFSSATELSVPIHQFECEEDEPALRAGPGELGPVTKFRWQIYGNERVASTPPKQLVAVTLVAQKTQVIYFTTAVGGAAELVERLQRAERLVYDGPCVPILKIDDEVFLPASDPDIHHPDHWTRPN